MNHLNLTKQAENDWHKLLNPTGYIAKIDESLYQQVVDFLGEDYSDIATNELQILNLKKLIQRFTSVFNVSIKRIRIMCDVNSTTLGGYDDKSETMIINATPELLSPKNRMMFLNTIFHELRHAQQYQKFSYFTDTLELSELIKHNLKNYQSSSTSAIKNAKYFSNFVEVDAELFSFNFSEMLLNTLKNNPKYNSNNEIISNAIVATNQERANMQEMLQVSQKAIELDNAAYNVFLKAIKEYKQLVFFTDHPDKKTIDALTENIMILARNFTDEHNSQYFDIDHDKASALIDALYDGVSTLTIAKYVDEPVLQFMEEFERKYCRFGKCWYHEHKITTIKNMARECSGFLRKYKIPSDPYNIVKTFETTLEILPAIYLENVKKHDNSESAKNDLDFLRRFSYVIQTSDSSNYIYNDFQMYCAKYVEKHIPRKDLQKIVEEIVDADINYLGYSDIRNNVLNRYGYEYYHAKQSKQNYGEYGSHERLLKVAGVRYDKESFSDIFDKCEKYMPHFLIRCLLKEELNENEMYMLKYLSENNDFVMLKPDSIKEEMMDELYSTPNAISDIKKLIKNPKEKTFIIDIINKRNVDFEKFINGFASVKINS